MRLGELIGMEIVNLGDASRLGRVSEVDAEIDAERGCLVDLRLLVRRGWLWGRRRDLPWEAVLRIGQDLIIVDLGAAAARSAALGPPPLRAVATRTNPGRT